MCGDATKDLDKLYNTKPDLLLTDPPYGMNLNTDFTDMKGISGGNQYRPVINDDKDFDPSHLMDYNEVFLWGADYYAERILNRNDGSWFVWDKTEGGIRTNSTYDKMFGSNFELCWSKVKHKRQVIPVLWKGIFGLSKEDTKKRIHPTQKPTKLIRFFIDTFSKENHSILDPYLGSGSTLIACEQTNRICYGMEIDPAYIDVIIQRWENFTGKKAIKIADKSISIQENKA
jgi:DNA modification methylase